MNALSEPICGLTLGQTVQGKGGSHQIACDPTVKQGRGLGHWIGHEAPGQKKRGDKREAEKGRGLENWIGYVVPGQKKRGDEKEAERERNNWIQNEQSTNETGKSKLRMKANGSLGSYRDGTEGLQLCAVS
ncbi:hypothetical protein K439DRAFT_1625552 [Ramaria rubella]|nr:hypothetical protein K439DRAFT_1625552 [Ramaria rubella]